MRISFVIAVTIVLASCVANKKKREWQSKKYPDSHFYTFLQQNYQLDTSVLKTDHVYVRKTCDTCFAFLYFSNDQKVYSTRYTKEAIDPAKFLNEKYFYGYFKTKHDTLLIERIGIYRFLLTKKGKGVFPSLYHVKTTGLLRKDTILLSRETVGINDFERVVEPNTFRLTKIK
jgi:hypothetical protein